MLLQPSLHFLTVTVPASPPPKIKRYVLPVAKYFCAKALSSCLFSSRYGGLNCRPLTRATASMFPSPDSPEMAKTSVGSRGWATVVKTEFSDREAIIASKIAEQANRTLHMRLLIG